MEDAVSVKDIEAYIERRRAYLSSKRYSAQMVNEKGKIIGMQQALSDLEGMIRQLRRCHTTEIARSTTLQYTNISYFDIANQWLIALNSSRTTLDDFTTDKRQNQVIAQHPAKKMGIIAFGQLVRNKELIENILSNCISNALHSSLNSISVLAQVAANKGNICPFCGKKYKYAKTMNTHIKSCSKNSGA